MNPRQDAELQAIAATLPLHMDFAWEDAASIEQAVQALTALADWAANTIKDTDYKLSTLADVVYHLALYKYIDMPDRQYHFWQGRIAKEDPRAEIYKGLVHAYLRHHNRIYALSAEAMRNAQA